MEFTNNEKLIIRNLLKKEIERLIKKKSYMGINKNEKIEYMVFLKLYKKLGEKENVN